MVFPAGSVYCEADLSEDFGLKGFWFTFDVVLLNSRMNY